MPADDRGVTVADLRAFYRAHYRPDNATLIVVGDVTPATVLPQLERRSAAGRPTGTAALVAGAGRAAAGHAPDLSGRQAGAPRSRRFASDGSACPLDPDYFALEVLNTVLGGSFTSRLNQNLREKNGYAYGARSAFDMRLSAGRFVAAAGVQTDKTGEALKEFFNELDGIRKPMPAEELRKAQELRRARLPRRIRNHRRSWRASSKSSSSTTCRTTTSANYVPNVGRGDSRRCAARRGAVHPAGQDGGGGRRRSEGHRGGRFAR